MISAIKQVATTVHNVDYEKEVENFTKKNGIDGILKYFGLMFVRDRKLRIYDQSLKFHEPPKKVVDLDQNYRIILDNFTNS